MGETIVSKLSTSVKDANEVLVDLLQHHCLMVQSGKFGIPTLEDLQFVGILHRAIEQHNEEHNG